MTTAQSIAHKLHNDGQTFETDDGVTLSEMLEQAPYWDNGTGMTVTVFDDGSMIGRNDEYWDIITVSTNGDDQAVWVDGAGESDQPWAVLDADDEPAGSWWYRHH